MLTALIIIALLIAAVLLYAALAEKTFSVVREADFSATPAQVFPLLNNFKNWGSWSPWEAMDPDLKRDYSGAEEGVGAKYGWTGNKKVGTGNMEITHSDKSKRVQLNLNFIQPFEAHNITEFTLTPAGQGTHLKWEMRGNRPYMIRLMGLVMSMDKMVGKDFEKGLANMKAQVDK